MLIHPDPVLKRVYAGNPLLPDRDDIPGVTRPFFNSALYIRRSNVGYMRLGVQLLQVCRQINQEGAPIFYGMYADYFHLHNLQYRIVRSLTIICCRSKYLRRRNR
jgi:hypothetical protein